MRVRSSHIVVVIVALICAFFVVVWLRTSQSPDAKDGNFLDEARKLREEGKGSDVTTGPLPPVDADMSEVASIEIPAETYDMGTIVNSHPTTKEMMVYNRGKAALEITEVTTSCACTVGEFPVNKVRPDGTKVTVIPPGGQLPLKITVDPDRIPGFHSDKLLTIFSNDPARPAAAFHVTSTVVPEYDLDPPDLKLSKVCAGDQAVHTVIVRRDNDPNLEIEGFEYSKKAAEPEKPQHQATPPEENKRKLNITFEKRPQEQWKSPDRPEWQFNVRLEPDVPVGSFRDYFIIISNSKRVDRIAYWVTGEVEAPQQPAATASAADTNAAQPSTGPDAAPAAPESGGALTPVASTTVAPAAAAGTDAPADTLAQSR